MLRAQELEDLRPKFELTQKDKDKEEELAKKDKEEERRFRNLQVCTSQKYSAVPTHLTHVLYPPASGPKI